MQTVLRIPLPFYKRHLNAQNSNTALAQRTLSTAERRADEIIQLLETSGAETRDGEPISQATHMLQCAMLAMEVLSDLPVIIGALLHDIGYLLKREQDTELIDAYGMMNPEKIGATYLRSNNFSDEVCAIVEQQTAAKRYLIATDKTY